MRDRLLLLALLVFVFLTRIGYVLRGAIPFGFDHGKDSLAIMHMVLTKSPAFIGPWTSIPGLFFGPGWYYLQAPAYLLGSFHPAAAVITMIALLLLQVYLAWKYFGKIAAIIISSAPLWIIISTSAWNPFPMTFITLVILIILKLIRKQGRITPKKALLLGLTASFGFHFSAAYAIFYPVAIGIVLLYLRPNYSPREVLMGAAGFIIPFVPQILFEVKNNFLQSRAVLDYFSVGEPQERSAEKALQVVKTVLGELQLSFMPGYRLLSDSVNVVIQTVLLIALVIPLLRSIESKRLSGEIKYYLVLASAFVVLPIIGFFFLHFNIWYVYAMAPVAALVVSELIKRFPKWQQYIFVVLLMITPVTHYANFMAFEREDHLVSKEFLPIKKEAINIIRERAGNDPFASYHYVSDIYDFSYQYLYLTDAYSGNDLPVDFAYKPNAEPYIVQKEALLNKIGRKSGDAEKIFYIVEKPEKEVLLTEWWGQQQYSKILETIHLSDDITIYVAAP